MIDIKKIDDILQDLLIECFNDLYEYNDIEKEKASLIYNNIELFIIKLKDRLIDEV